MAELDEKRRPAYIYHQGRQHFCYRRYGYKLISDRRKDAVRDRVEDRKLSQWHQPLDLRLQKLHARKGWIVGKYRMYFDY